MSKKDKIPADATNALPALLNLMSLTKHKAFKEENEVRIASWILKDNEEEFEKNIINTQKHIKYRGTENNISYIEFFSKSGINLPIKKIIVGPSKDKKMRARDLKNYVRKLNLNIKITISETPFN